MYEIFPLAGAGAPPVHAPLAPRVRLTGVHVPGLALSVNRTSTSLTGLPPGAGVVTTLKFAEELVGFVTTTPVASSMVGGVKLVSDGDVYSTLEEMLVNSRWLPDPGLLGSGTNWPVTRSSAWWDTGAPVALNSWYVATRWRVAGNDVSYWEIWFSGPDVSLSASAMDGVKLPTSVEVRPVIRAPWATEPRVPLAPGMVTSTLLSGSIGNPAVVCSRVELFTS